jgi:hypothetical protein
MLQCVT